MEFLDLRINMAKKTFKIPPKVTKKIKLMILNAMADISKEIPIKWDRVVDCGARIQIYGWILKENSVHFDFVLIYVDLEHDFMNYVTSSVQYSKKMLINWEGTDRSHTDCIPFKEYFKDVDKNDEIETEKNKKIE